MYKCYLVWMIKGKIKAMEIWKVSNFLFEVLYTKFFRHPSTKTTGNCTHIANKGFDLSKNAHV